MSIDLTIKRDEPETIQFRTLGAMKRKLVRYADQHQVSLTRLIWLALADYVKKDDPELSESIIKQM